jgi:hypothetical protein
LVTKAVAQRGRDLADIESLLEVHPHLNLAQIRYWTSQFSAALEMPEIAECLERALKKQR